MAGMVALLLQVIAWGWMPLASGAPRNGEMAPLLICSSGGLTSIAVDAADYAIGDNGSQKAPDHAVTGLGHCPLCPLVAGLAPPPPPLTVGPALAMTDDTRLLPAERIAAGWFLSTLQARAPPSIA
ncbi:DUF2946 family protein [Azospirillum sp. B510]|uniref:DUF2946 family protein n=1 Tax=Azospirillum sp. (strain B510) TaxID=137722 RepID=UPI0002E4B46F|nr:DUF2946 family protein [Azospirillum sp. B510]